ncbi:leader peptidase (prepilin peptidase)/N-methyltransferase [Blastococcus colisei]|uniref:Leader peptidase (Prepilin peptidase)/N-methyltransferase n=1 Tax=Blastococcus colisei TaxID=1564162 RepID=A0A543PI76_9ACTN|nr:peptidase [Blastococcus colisei]TQN43754.1 leader peptidase (prepilin peptidase)/N-methyltransferase [Blastococcus colisei]
MNGTWMVASVAGALFGAAATPRLTTHGLAQLARIDAVRPGLAMASAAAGGGAGAAAIVTSHRAGTWWLVPALLVWGCALVAAASCDAVTQRIPTPLVRQAAVVTGVLLTVGFAMHGDWRGLFFSGLAAVAAGVVLLLCWRFAGAGFGDVRLAMLGGLGLGHATHHGLLLALAAFTLITVTQAVITLMRGGGRQSTFPYGPALAAGFLLAATL